MVKLEGKSKAALLVVRYFVVNGVFAASIYYGMFAELFDGVNIAGAENLALFMAWVTGILGSVVAIAFAVEKSKGTQEYSEIVARSDPSPIPFWFDLLFDMCVCAALVWTGHYILVLFYIVSIYAGKALRDVPKNMVLNKLMSQQK